jgi:GNAT superfamily N-acetyltransferase
MFSDTALARRIEHGEALNAAGCGESIAIAGGYAAFAGVGSPLTHAVGLGLNGPVTAVEFDVMEQFYRSRGTPVNLEFCPHADPSLVDLLGTRGYRIVECNNVLAAPVAGSWDARVRMARSDEQELWSRVMIEGFFARTMVSEAELHVGMRLFRLEAATAWFGMADGQPAAAGAMNVRAKLALLFADATRENFRGQGLHLALIRARLAHAATLGCDLATAATAPGSGSQRNYERAGFRVVYTKLNMQRDWR